MVIDDNRLDRLTDEFKVVREDFQVRISTVQGAMLVTFPALKDIGFKHVNVLRRWKVLRVFSFWYVVPPMASNLIAPAGGEEERWIMI